MGSWSKAMITVFRRGAHATASELSLDGVAVAKPFRMSGKSLVFVIMGR
jgi:hypothetical protein